MDIGASNHMCGDESFFSELTKVEVGLVSCGDDSKMVIKGRGTIQHMQKDGQVGEIRDVYYVLELKSNIFSIGQIVEKGNSIMIKNQVLYLKDKHDGLAARVEKEKNWMYKLELSILQKRCLKRVDSEGNMGFVQNDLVKKETCKQIKAMRSEREVTTNLVEEVEEEAVLLMMGCSSRDEHKQVEKPTRRLSVINQTSSMERSSSRANSSENLAESVEILNNSIEHVESLMEHEASLVSSVGSPDNLIKLVEQVECPYHLKEQVNISESLAGNLGSSDSSTWIVVSSNLEQEEQLHAKKDLRVVLEVQDEKWRLEINDEFGVKKAWQLSDPLKRTRPIQRNLVNGKSTTKNPTKCKSTKVKMKSAKEKIKSDKERSSRLKRKASRLWR